MSEPRDRAFGTADIDAPVSRGDFERALRALNLADLEIRDAVLQLGSRVVTLIDELTRRIDRVEPEPAEPGTPAPEPTRTVEAAVAELLPRMAAQVRIADARGEWRVSLDLGADKYEVTPVSPPCEELIDLCKARCCSYNFALSTKDLDEGIIRWDYGQPYLNRQRASDGYCVHHDPNTNGCTVHKYRPRVCRTYDCRKDKRVWIDYEQRIPAPMEPVQAGEKVERAYPDTPSHEFELMQRVKARVAAVAREKHSMSNSYADHGPVEGPPAPDAPVGPIVPPGVKLE